MNNDNSCGSQTNKKQYRKLQKVLSNLDRMHKTLDESVYNRKFNSISLKKLSMQFQYAFSSNTQASTKKKKRLSTVYKHIRKESIEAVKKILDYDSPNSKKFITENIMQKNSVFKILQDRKRHFGETKLHLCSPDFSKQNTQVLPEFFTPKVPSIKTKNTLFESYEIKPNKSTRQLTTRSHKAGNSWQNGLGYKSEREIDKKKTLKIFDRDRFKRMTSEDDVAKKFRQVFFNFL
ncbi:hypothetical protein SteCoe_10238 [Stentor coeruleus]|uniref:Uncharacterized protein n=1 Tax=Stentor coeruleus TaxID=5963 RepID=A0A1R2CFW4_9CILI|nr:hypothetical protein SteCoe_10238 [Stentor coeruleus]